MPSANLSQQQRLPLPPQPSASLECLLARLDLIYWHVRRRWPHLSDAVALHARDAALDAGLEALETGKAERMSAEQRAGWIWTVAKCAAFRAANHERHSFPLTYDRPDCRRPAGNEDRPLIEIIRQALEQLTEQQRKAVTLCVLQGLTRAEAAREMAIARATVCRHLEAGFVRLRKELAALAPDRIPGENPAGR